MKDTRSTTPQPPAWLPAWMDKRERIREQLLIPALLMVQANVDAAYQHLAGMDNQRMTPEDIIENGFHADSIEDLSELIMDEIASLPRFSEAEDEDDEPDDDAEVIDLEDDT